MTIARLDDKLKRIEHPNDKLKRIEHLGGKLNHVGHPTSLAPDPLIM